MKQEGQPLPPAAKANKDATIFILDTAASMYLSNIMLDNQKSEDTAGGGAMNNRSSTISTRTNPNPNRSDEDENEEKKNRLSKSKGMIESFIIDAMKRTKTNEIGVLLLNTEKTDHHLHFDDDSAVDDDQKEDTSKNTNDDDDDNDDNDNDNDDNDNVEHQTKDCKKHILFQHITELIPLRRPTIHDLRELRSIPNQLPQRSNNSNNSNNCSGNSSTNRIIHDCGGFINGIILATDILHMRTNSKKFNRKIVLFTDGENAIDEMQYQYLDVILDSMRDMNCTLEIYGFDFDSFHDDKEGTCSNDNDNDNDDSQMKKPKIKDEEEEEEEGGNQDHYETTANISVLEERQALSDTNMNISTNTTSFDVDMIKSENQKLLLSLVKYTSGKIHSLRQYANNTTSTSTTLSISIDDTMDRNSGGSKYYKKTSLFKTTLNIAPNNLLSIPIRMSAYTAQEKIPSLKTRAIVYETSNNRMSTSLQHSDSDTDIDDDHRRGNNSQFTSSTLGQSQKVIKKDALGNDVTFPFTRYTTHWDVEDDEVEVDLKHRIQGYMYGSDVIPVTANDWAGLKPNHDHLTMPPCINILGYSSLDAFPMRYWIGPLKIISPDSNKETPFENSCKIFSSMAQALYNMKKVAVCTYLRNKNSDPVVYIIAPLVQEGKKDKTTSFKQEMRNKCTQMISSNDDRTPSDRTIAETNTERGPPISTPMISHMTLVRIPFAEDVQSMNLSAFEEDVDNTDAEKVCDDFIDHFMLPSNVLQSETLPNHAIQSFHETVINRAIDPSAKERIIITRDDECRDVKKMMKTPPELLDSGKDILENFRCMFPLEVIKQDTATDKGRKKQKQYWKQIEYSSTQ